MVPVSDGHFNVSHRLGVDHIDAADGRYLIVQLIVIEPSASQEFQLEVLLHGQMQVAVGKDGGHRKKGVDGYLSLEGTQTSRKRACHFLVSCYHPPTRIHIEI